MSDDRKFFYVIGGEYTDAEFSDLRSGSAVMDGPFHDRASAVKAWQSRSLKTTSNALERYDVVELMHTIPRSAMIGLGATAA